MSDERCYWADEIDRVVHNTERLYIAWAVMGENLKAHRSGWDADSVADFLAFHMHDPALAHVKSCTEYDEDQLVNDWNERMEASERGDERPRATKGARP